MLGSGGLERVPARGIPALVVTRPSHSPESLARVLGGGLPTASKLDRGIRFQGLMDDVNDRDLPKGYVTALVFGSETESTKQGIHFTIWDD